MAGSGSARVPTQRGSTTRRTGFGDTSVQGHRRGGGPRPSQLRSIQTQLLAPIIVAMIGLAVLGTAQTTTATASARDAQRARTLATTATSTVRFVHELERELAETAALRQRGGKSGLQLVKAQQQRADTAATTYRKDSEAAVEAAPELAGPVRAADALLDRLPSIRENATSPQTGVTADPVYHSLAEALLAVADALPAQIADIELANAARTVAAVASIEHFAALERDQLRTVFVRGRAEPGELNSLAQISGAKAQRESEFNRIATPAQAKVYADAITGIDVDNAKKMSDKAFNADSDPAGLKADGDAWYTAQSNVIRRLNLVGLQLTDSLDAQAAKIATNATRRAWGTAIGTAIIGLAALITAIALAVRTARRLRSLRAAALTVARRDLPEAINSVITGNTPAASAESGPSAAAVTRSIAATNDEIGQVADAFGTVHRTALRLAGEQAELRVDVGRMAEVLARRIRTLITRQLRLLDEFERDETDPDALARLFALDHIAARLRRNGENLLVLAGGEPGRPVTQAVPLGAVITAAASEIEDFHRVESTSNDVAIAGPVVGDVVHLLAELLENAATFSPPSNPVRVDARRTVDGALVRVHDTGIGINQVRLAEINARLVQPTALSSAAAGTMGLYVVAHLAARHGIRVQLHVTGTGTTALVALPHRVLALPSALAAGGRPGAAEPMVVPSVVGAPMGAPEMAQAGVGATSLGRLRPGFHQPAAQPVAQPAGASANQAGAATWFRPYLSGGGTRQQQGAATGGGLPGAWTPQPVVNAPAASPSGAAMSAPPPTTTSPPAGSLPSPAGNGTLYGGNGSAHDERTAAYPTLSAPASPDLGDGGLPRRRPGEQLAPQVQAAPPPPAQQGAPTAAVDPEVIRARLSAFAEGVSAALRRSNTATPAQKER
jgi:signal transduction histidine kinase